MLVGRIGKGRKVVSSGRRYPLRHRANEFPLRPSADAIDRIGRDIRRVKRSERRRYREAATEPGTIGLVGNSMAGGTSARVEGCQSFGKIGSVGRRGNRQHGRWSGEPPINSKSGGAGQNNAKENSSRHSLIRHCPSQD